MNNKLTKLYDRLTNAERFSAFIAAASRIDCEEMDALNNSCPRKTYTMDDWEYTRMKYRFLMTLTETRLRVARFTSALSGLAIAAAYCDDAVSDSSIESARKVIVTYRAVRLAWERFCEQAGVSATAGNELLDSDQDGLLGFLLDALSEDAIGEIPEPSAEQVQREMDRIMGSWMEATCNG